MDGGDLMAVLEGRIELPDLLQRKKDFAVQKRRVFVRAGEIFERYRNPSGLFVRDGGDLMAVSKAGLNFQDLLQRKK